MSEAVILHYFHQIALALDYLHSHHYVHRDIKAANIFLTRSGDVKLGDLGLSIVLPGSDAMASTFCGTILHTSPQSC